MAHLTAAAHRLFATQHGVASVEQLVGAGLTPRRIKRLEAHGAIVGVLRGAYRSPSVGNSTNSGVAQRLRGPSGRGRSPVRRPDALWGFRRSPSRRTHSRVGCHRRATRRSPHGCRRIARPPSTNRMSIQRADGVRVTTRARTAFDLARWLGPDDLLSVIEQAIARRQRSPRRTSYEVAVDWLSPQRKWAMMFLRQLLAPPPRRCCRIASGSAVRRGPRAPWDASVWSASIGSICRATATHISTWRCHGCSWRSRSMSIRRTRNGPGRSRTVVETERRCRSDGECVRVGRAEYEERVRSVGVGDRRSVPEARSPAMSEWPGSRPGRSSRWRCGCRR